MSTNEIRIFDWPTSKILPTWQERSIHALIWVIGLIWINIPSLDLTINIFYSEDYSLLVPSLYGTMLNALLFYSVSEKTMAGFTRFSSRTLVEMIAFFLVLSSIEFLLDLAYDVAFYRKDFSMAGENLQGNFLLNFLFFFLPALIFGIIKGWRQLQSHQNKKILIRDGNKKIYLQSEEIYYLESNGNYVNYFTKDGTILERVNLSHVEKTLPEYFIRCHRSFIVNGNHITQITGNSICLKDLTVPIGRTYRGDFEKKYGDALTSSQPQEAK
ncbi:MAG: LytTR family DNA-binding domain-containing protein [Cyclobacteriaceae bacterium]